MSSTAGFIAPPGAGTGGLPLKSLFGFERVHVRAGETVTVTLYPGLLHFAPAAADGTRRALGGNYVVSFGVAEGAALGMGYAEIGLRAT